VTLTKPDGTTRTLLAYGDRCNLLVQPGDGSDFDVHDIVDFEDGAGSIRRAIVEIQEWSPSRRVELKLGPVLA
jgi:hypothetical protein